MRRLLWVWASLGQPPRTQSSSVMSGARPRSIPLGRRRLSVVQPDIRAFAIVSLGPPQKIGYEYIVPWDLRGRPKSHPRRGDISHYEHGRLEYIGRAYIFADGVCRGYLQKVTYYRTVLGEIGGRQHPLVHKYVIVRHAGRQPRCRGTLWAA